MKLLRRPQPRHTRAATGGAYGVTRITRPERRLGALSGATLICTPEQLEQALGGPSLSRGVNTIRDHLADVDIRWLAGCPMWTIGTGSDDQDVSPRGGEPGAIHVLDATTLVLAELPGTRRGDCYNHFLRNPQIGILFEIPGRLDALRVSGTAVMVKDAPWFDRLAVDGVRPPLAIVVGVTKVFYHCVKARRRSHTWDPEFWDPDGAPSRREVAAELSQVLNVPIACEEIA